MSGPAPPAAKETEQAAPLPGWREAEPAPVPPAEGSDWHDQIRAASRLLALAMDRLRLDDHHDPLARLSQLYRKVSLAVFPPFRAALQPRAAAAPAPEDADVALPPSDHHGLASLLTVLATALACAGAASLEAIGSLLHDRYRPGAGGEESGAEESGDKESGDKESGAEESAAEESGAEEFATEKSAAKESAAKESAAEESAAEESAAEESAATLTGASSAEARLMQSSAIVARALTSDSYRPPPAASRSAWENSVMARFHVQPAGDHALVRYEPLAAGAGPDSPAKAAILKYHVALKLRETFGFGDDNRLLGHFDVWLAKDVLLQGHMYITRDAVCFYSVLPGQFSATELSDPELALHAGPLGHKLAHYGESVFSSVYTNRFWAVLRPQTLSIYTSPTKLYFPVRTIDLRTAVSCEILEPGTAGFSVASPVDSPSASLAPTEPLVAPLAPDSSGLADDDSHEENVQAGVWFKINCSDKSYRFHTSSIYSARHWYNSISKAIFLLHNANSQREVVLRLPIEDITGHTKNPILAGPDALDAPDEDTPVSFSIAFSAPPDANDSKLHKLKLKTKKSHDASVVQDHVHFLVFRRGEELCDCFENVLERSEVDATDRNRKLKKKAKRFFHEERVDLMSLHFKSQNRVMTTIQPDYCSNVSIIDRIVDINTKITLSREKELAKLAEEQANALLDQGTDLESKKFAYVPNFKIMKDKLLPKSSPLSSLSTFGEGLFEGFRKDAPPTPSQDIEISDLENHLQTPKPFNLQMLKDLDIQMVRRRRDFKDIAGQYGNLLEYLKTKRARDKAFDKKPNAEGSDNDLKSNDTKKARKDPGSGEASKRAKLRSLKKLLRTVSTMGGVWSAKPEHYDRVFGHSKYYVANRREKARALNHFRNHFSLGAETHLVATYYAHLKKAVPVFGRLYVGKDQLCFRSMIPGVSTKMVLPLRDIQSCRKRPRLYQYAGLVVRIRGLNDLQLVFGSKDARDDCQKVILKLVRKVGRYHLDSEFVQDDELSSSMDIDETEKQNAKSEGIAKSRVHAARLRLLEDKISYATGIDMPLILEDSPFTTTEVKLAKCYKITLLTIGSRGDVQPYIALGKALVKEGHEVTIATHAEFEDWITKNEIKFKEVAGNPAALMQLMVSHGSISVGFLKEASTKFRGWIGELLETSWKACQGAELLIESPSAMAGLHIAEALNIPYMRAFTMPWTRTRAYPHAFLVPDQNRGGSYNFLTHVMFENVFWKGISGQVNKWRQETLGLRRTSLVKMQQTRIPFLYNVSPAMFPPSVDFPEWVKVTGYWFLDEGSDEYEPPEELVKFLEEAKSNNEKIVYVGFGSIVVSNAKALTETIVEAVVELGVKCILNKGWSDKMSKHKDEIEVKLPPQVYDAGMIPHDWLFPRIDAAVHHGGSGTTGATLRAGLPTIIKPFFGDQFFFASRVEDLGAGIALKNLNKKSFTKALKSITSEQKFSAKAVEIGKNMSHERGVYSAIEAIYTELAYSRSLILVIRNNAEQRKSNGDKTGAQTLIADDEAFDMLDETQEGDTSDEMPQGDTSDENTA